MKLSTLFISAFASIALADDPFPYMPVDKACKQGDECQRGVTGDHGKPPLSKRLADCRALDVFTVIPPTVTVTVFINNIVIRIPTGLPVKRLEDGTPAEPLVPRGAVAEPTTISPTETPVYATYCTAPVSYFSACSCAGITAITTTLPTPTLTVTTTSDACLGRRLVRRVGEAFGYEYAPRWDEHNIPGYNLF